MRIDVPAPRRLPLRIKGEVEPLDSVRGRNDGSDGAIELTAVPPEVPQEMPLAPVSQGDVGPATSSSTYLPLLTPEIGLFQLRSGRHGGSGPGRQDPGSRLGGLPLYRAGRYWALTAGAFWRAATH